MKLRTVPAVSLTEAQFARQVVELARWQGWRVYRTWISVHSPAGFPDLVMVRDGRLIVAELKSEKGQPTPAQQDWLAALRQCGASETHLWRPSDWPEVEQVLARCVHVAVGS